MKCIFIDEPVLWVPSVILYIAHARPKNKAARAGYILRRPSMMIFGWQYTPHMSSGGFSRAEHELKNHEHQRHRHDAQRHAQHAVYAGFVCLFVVQDRKLRHRRARRGAEGNEADLKHRFQLRMPREDAGGQDQKQEARSRYYIY